MRAVSSLALLLLAACDSSDDGQQAQVGAAEPGLECATDGASDYATGCTIEHGTAHDSTILTLRSPTGSFRRLRVAGGRIEAADGAEPARLLGDDGKRVSVAIGGDRYLIPKADLR
jgi:hypothetical protein